MLYSIVHKSEHLMLSSFKKNTWDIKLDINYNIITTIKCYQNCCIIMKGFKSFGADIWTILYEDFNKCGIIAGIWMYIM